MKRLFILLFSGFLFIPVLTLAQAPLGFTYQAVARDASGEVVSNQDVAFRISLLSGSTDGASVYSEKHYALTNQFGLVTLTIGQGVDPSGSFAAINWGNGPYFLKVEFDPAGGSNFSLMGVNQLLSVPYALYAENVGSGGATLPEVVTLEPTEITAREANPGGIVVNDGGEVVLLKGICWSTSPNPTTSDTISGSGVGTGEFKTALSKLDDATTFYVRAFATNRLGTAYGNEITFTTLPLNGTVTDIDGNVYATIRIGTQHWMAENLQVSRYRNGDFIAGNLTNAQWSTASSGAYAWPNNNPAYDTIYGKLYNWFAVADTNGLCPQGWAVPKDEDWFALITYLGGSLVTGGKLKSTRTAPDDPHPRWDGPNTEASNESGFSGFPGGDRFTGGLYYNFGKIGTFWSSTQSNAVNAWSRGLSYASAGITRNSNDKRYGFSVRCLEKTEER